MIYDLDKELPVKAKHCVLIASDGSIYRYTDGKIEVTSHRDKVILNNSLRGMMEDLGVELVEEVPSHLIVGIAREEGWQQARESLQDIEARRKRLVEERDLRRQAADCTKRADAIKEQNYV